MRTALTALRHNTNLFAQKKKHIIGTLVITPSCAPFLLLIEILCCPLGQGVREPPHSRAVYQLVGEPPSLPTFFGYSLCIRSGFELALNDIKARLLTLTYKIKHTCLLLDGFFQPPEVVLKAKFRPQILDFKRNYNLNPIIRLESV